MHISRLQEHVIIIFDDVYVLRDRIVTVFSPIPPFHCFRWVRELPLLCSLVVLEKLDNQSDKLLVVFENERAFG